MFLASVLLSLMQICGQKFCGPLRWRDNSLESVDVCLPTLTCCAFRYLACRDESERGLNSNEATASSPLLFRHQSLDFSAAIICVFVAVAVVGAKSALVTTLWVTIWS